MSVKVISFYEAKDVSRKGEPLATFISFSDVEDKVETKFARIATDEDKKKYPVEYKAFEATKKPLAPKKEEGK